MPRKPPPTPRRPFPPASLVEGGGTATCFAPAHGVAEWVGTELLSDTGVIHNPDHLHLVGADIAYLWAASGFESKMRQVIGTAEELTFRCNAWQRGRQEQQLVEWFGRLPDFLITLDAGYCLQCTDAEWGSLIEHELYHIAQKVDRMGAPRFQMDGQPALGIQGHDVEEFVGVVRRYGVGHPGGKLAQLVAAASTQPEVSGYRLATACGTCLLRAA